MKSVIRDGRSVAHEVRDCAPTGIDAQRGFDLIMAAAVLPVVFPVILVAASLVRVTMGRPVLFRHTRAGLHGRSFALYKLRTMRPGRPGESDDERLTRTGRWLRSLSIDELPQFWNVFRGDMSIVGPRPLLPQYLALYTPLQARRHDVRPGITGLAQVSGRNALSWSDRLALDVWYVEHRSVMLDAKLAMRTIAAVLTRRGVSAPGQATMSEFKGAPDAAVPALPIRRLG